MTTAERERVQKIKEWKAKKRAEDGQPDIEPKQLIRSGLRLLSVGRIILASIMPGVRPLRVLHLEYITNYLYQYSAFHSIGLLLRLLALSKHGRWIGGLFDKGG
jgi:hypothetical protein